MRISNEETLFYACLNFCRCYFALLTANNRRFIQRFYNEYEIERTIEFEKERTIDAFYKLKEAVNDVKVEKKELI